MPSWSVGLQIVESVGRRQAFDLCVVPELSLIQSWDISDSRSFELQTFHIYHPRQWLWPRTSPRSHEQYLLSIGYASSCVSVWHLWFQIATNGDCTVFQDHFGHHSQICGYWTTVQMENPRKNGNFTESTTLNSSDWVQALSQYQIPRPFGSYMDISLYFWRYNIKPVKALG